MMQSLPHRAAVAPLPHRHRTAVAPLPHRTAFPFHSGRAAVTVRRGRAISAGMTQLIKPIVKPIVDKTMSMHTLFLDKLAEHVAKLGVLALAGVAALLFNMGKKKFNEVMKKEPVEDFAVSEDAKRAAICAIAMALLAWKVQEQAMAEAAAKTAVDKKE